MITFRDRKKIIENTDIVIGQTTGKEKDRLTNIDVYNEEIQKGISTITDTEKRIALYRYTENVLKSKYFIAYSDDFEKEYIYVKHKNPIILVIILGVICIALTLGLRSCTEPAVGNEQNTAPDSDISDGSLYDMSEEEKQALIQDILTNGAFRLNLQSKPTIKDGKLNIRFENGDVNNTDVYFVIKQKDKTVYQSEILKPDSYIEYATITGRCEAGPAQVIVYYLDKYGDLYNNSCINITIME